jgi:uncharacterized protein involved in exopolysaccharide biosynthesis
MQNTPTSSTNNEIDLSELFVTLWAYKLLIAIICIIGILYAGYYSLNASKVFTSTAIFKLNDQQSNRISINKEISSLVNLAGLARNSSSGISLSKLNGRIFIEEIDAKVDFQNDPYFNNYNNKIEEPTWKSIIKRVIGWQKSSTNIQEIIWDGITRKYKQNIKVSKNDDGSTSIIVTHSDSVRAAKIANIVMKEIIFITKNDADTQQDNQLSYLSNTLAKSLSDLEISQSKLKAFALDNSALPLKSFAVGSFQLETLRENLSRTTELHEAIAQLSFMLKNKTITKMDYLSLRKKHPIVDQVEFRQVLGQNETFGSWNWPKISTVTTVLESLSERKNMLISQIDTSKVEAQRTSQALEVYGRLQREAKIAEATYTVLIEQVKAQSMMAGYRPSKAEIYEYASPATGPTVSSRKLILALGAGLGLLVGFTLAIVIAYFRGVLYSKKSLIGSTQARLNASSKALMTFRNKSLKEINKKIAKNPLPVLRDISVEIHKSGVTEAIFTSSRTRLKANEIAQALALTMQSEDTKIAVINFSNKKNKYKIDDNKVSKETGLFDVRASEGHVSVLTPEINIDTIELVKRKDFLENLRSLNSNYDLIFLCANDKDIISLIRVLEGQKVFHLTLARIKKTRLNTILSMRALLPIQGLLYD